VDGVNPNATAVPLATFTPVIPNTGNTVPTAAPVGGSAGASTGGSAGGVSGATCNAAPAGWVAYTLQQGDSLGVLAQQGNVSVEQIVAANCLPNPDMIPAGQVIYVPPAAAGNTANSAANTGSTTGTTNGGTTGRTAPNTGPAIQNIWVEPAVVVDSQYVVSAGASITLRAGAVTNAAKVTFMMSPVGSNVAPTVIAVDSNLADGVSVKWTVPANLRANIWAVATNSANENTQTQPIVVYTR
jgi:LysM repeat protein